ncbi:MAG: hypothetical protein U9N87_09470, partial [Planctomycetota bacterium]|nr:hypothetical protein [Planctomycetota bacterium]
AEKRHPKGEGDSTTAGGRIWTPYYTWGIYLDNSGEDVTIYGNIVISAVLGGVAMPVASARNNRVENNIFVNCSGNQMDLRMAGGALGNRFLRNIIYYKNPTAMLLAAHSHVKRNVAQCDYNLYYSATGQALRIRGIGDGSFAAWKRLGFDEHSLLADPLFVDAAGGDYRLRPESPAFKLGFKPIPVHRIGLLGSGKMGQKSLSRVSRSQKEQFQKIIKFSTMLGLNRKKISTLDTHSRRRTMNVRGIAVDSFYKCVSIVWLVCLVTIAIPAVAADPVTVVVGPKAPELERHAGRELCGYLQKLYGIRTAPSENVAGENATGENATDYADVAILIGSPETNPAVKKHLPHGAWPQLSDQGLAIIPCRAHGKPAVVVGGGSPRATLWAVYELVERWGVRYLLHGDVLPKTPGKLKLPAKPIVMEPVFRVRQWRVVNDFPSGPESWGMADYRPVLDQLAKLKFNRILVSTWPWQPFLHLEVDGVARGEAWLWFKWHYPITDDMPGRQLFGDAKEFWNPDLPLGASYAEFSAAGEQLLHNLMGYAHKRGMESVLTAKVTAFPHEFKDSFTGARPMSSMSKYTMIPGPDTPMDDPGLVKLAKAVLQTSVNTYPEADYLQLGVTEQRKWSGEYKNAWKALDAKYGLSKSQGAKTGYMLEKILEEARQRKNYPGGADRAVSEVKADLTTLYFLDRLIREGHVFRDTKRPDVKLVYEAFAEELYPLLDRILPPGSETLNFVDYTSSRVLKRQDTLAALGGKKIPAALIYTLHDDNVGLLPMLVTGSLHKLDVTLREHAWAGFSTRYWIVSDHDPCVAYLARASWDAEATPQSVYADLVENVCGKQCVSDMLEAFRELEATTVLLELKCLGVGFATPGMVGPFMTASSMPAQYVDAREGYRRALAAVRRAREKTCPAGEPFV